MQPQSSQGVDFTATGSSDEFREFNHYWNIQLCVMKCINSSGNLTEYIPAVEQLEATLVSDLNSRLQLKLDELSKRLDTEMGIQSSKPIVQFKLAREKYRVLYGFMKERAPVKAVLAIGKPEKCYSCGEVIQWNRIRKEEKEVVADVALPEE